MKSFRQRVCDAKSKLKDSEFFLGNASHNFFNTMIEGVTKMYNRVIKLKLVDKNDGSTASCSILNKGFLLTVNINNPLCAGKSREEKFRFLKGLVLHECGHILFTDFYLAMQNISAMKKNELYPAPNHRRYEEYRNFITTSNAINNAITLWQRFDNILEDGFIEKILISIYRGYGKSLVLLRKHHYDSMESFETMQDNGVKEWHIALNLLLCYAKYGRVKCDMSNKNNATIRFLMNHFEDVDEILETKNAYIRQELKNSLFVDYILFIKELMEDENNDSQDDSQGNSQSDGQGNSQSDGQGNSQSDGQGNSQSDGQGDSQKTLDEILNELNNNISDALNGDNADFSAMNNVRSVEISSQESSTLQNSNSPTPLYEGTENDAGENVESILNKLSEQTAVDKINEELEEELIQKQLREMKEVPYGKFHTSTTSSFNRKPPTDDEIEAYEQAKSTLLPISKKLQANLKKELKDMREGSKLNGLYMGRRIDTPSISRYDKKIMCKNIAPVDVPDMAVCLLVDESGSMSGQNIDCARNTAFIVYDFCRALNIPIAIYGHTSSDNHVSIYSYAEFNSVDGKDKYRIMGMRARCCNRDGYALRYAVNRLEKQSADVKLMIVISDGSPNSENYGFSEGKIDIQQLLKEKSPKGIKFITAGLGIDMPYIKNIYTQGLSEKVSAKFLEIDVLDKLPKTLVGIIKKYVKG